MSILIIDQRARLCQFWATFRANLGWTDTGNLAKLRERVKKNSPASFDSPF